MLLAQESKDSEEAMNEKMGESSTFYQIKWWGYTFWAKGLSFSKACLQRIFSFFFPLSLASMIIFTTNIFFTIAQSVAVLFILATYQWN